MEQPPLLPKFYYRCKITNAKFGSFATCLLVAQTPKALMVAGLDRYMTSQNGRQCCYRPSWIPRACILIDPVPLFECARCHGLVPKPNKGYNPNRDDNMCPPCYVDNLKDSLKLVNRNLSDDQAKQVLDMVVKDRQ